MPAETSYTIRKEAVALEHTLADVRLILWFTTAIITRTIHGEVSRNQGWLIASLSVFLVYSLGMIIIVRYFPRLLRGAVLVSSFIEVIIITVLIWASYAPLTPFYLWYVFYVVSISLRFGMQISIIGLAASVVLYTAVSVLPPNPTVYVPNFLGYTGFLFILAFLFGHMSERQRSYQDRLVVVNELGVALVSLSTSKEIIRLLVSQTAHLFGAGKCWFVPHKGVEENQAPLISLGISNDELNTIDGKLGGWSPANVLVYGQVMISNNPRRDCRLPSELLKLLSLKSLAAVPLYVRDVPVGVLYVADKPPRGFSGYNVELLELIGAQAAPIIENIQLWERLKEAAASEERLRIARDLHDNFLQTLSAIKLYLERCKLLIDKDSEKAKASVDRLHEISTQGLADVRSYLSQLRLMGPEPSRFGQAAERSALEAAARGGFAVYTDIEVAEDALGRQISLAAFQILRELLNNIIKHATAANVWVKAISMEGNLELEVRDDGSGFDSERGQQASEEGHLGLVGIEERVKELGGTFDLKSKPGEGTCARIVLPIKNEE